MVIAGCTRLPCGGDDAALGVHLERAVAGVGKVPSGIRILKKPSPRMATSSVLPVCVSVPCVISRGVPTVLTPEPSSMPAGRMLPWSEVCVPMRLHVLVEQVLKLGALALVAGGAHVGDVVGDDLDVEFLGHHAGRCGVEAHAWLMLLTLIRPGRRRAAAMRVAALVALLLQHAGDLGVGCG